MVFERINSWFLKYKTLFFTYSEGFFNLTFLANNPELIVKSCSVYPFSKIDELSSSIVNNSPFMDGLLKYQKIESDLWILYSKVFYKNNILFKPCYDKNCDHEFYCLVINKVDNQLQHSSYKFNDIIIHNYTISIVKPYNYFNTYHYKGALENQIIIYFSYKWYLENIKCLNSSPENLIDFFENGTSSFLNFNIDIPIFKDNIYEFIDLFERDGKLDTFKLKKSLYVFLDLFFGYYDDLNSLNFSKLKKTDVLKLHEIERYLVNNLYNKFEGIDFLSNKFNISSTKLKKDFKNLFGCSIYNYFQGKQMEIAYDLIKRSNYKVKEVSMMFKYENSSKFSTAFKKKYKMLPSEIKSIECLNGSL